MRYLYLITSDPNQGPPPAALMEEMGKLLSDPETQKHLVTTGGLTPLAQGARIATKGGKVIVTDGPFAETKEVIGGYAIFEYDTREAALASARRFMQLHADTWPQWQGVCEMRAIAEG